MLHCRIVCICNPYHSNRSLVVQQMAMGAAQNAASSVAAGGSASAGAAAGGAAGGAASNSTTQAGAAGTAVTVAAIAAGLVVSGKALPPLCPNVFNPDIVEGRIAIDFLGTAGRLTVDQASLLETTFVDSYNAVFGCNSVYSRVALNCTIPCDTGENSARRCCVRVSDDIFGGVLRCPFECFVHCDGCPLNEPLFLIESTNETFFPTVAATNFSVGFTDTTNDTSPPAAFSTGDRSLQTEPGQCPPQCLVTRSVEDMVCGTFYNESHSCLAVRSETFENLLPDNQVEEVTLIPAPSSSPSDVPSTVPSVSPSQNPMAVPSTTPTVSPSTNPSVLPSISPSQQPSGAPSVSPSQQPSGAPSSWPTRAPTLMPSASPSLGIFEDLVLYDGSGNELGSLDGTVIIVSVVGSELTVEARVRSLVTEVDFFFDGEYVSNERMPPYYLNNDHEGVGIAYSPLAVPGDHWITATAIDADGALIGNRTATFATVESRKTRP
jgi:hypothetical protein